MRNIFLKPFYEDLYFKVAQFLFSDNHIHNIAAIENLYKDDNMEDACNFAKICKNFSLPATMLDKNFQILSQGENATCFSLNFKDYDIIVSLFNLHTLSKEEQIQFIRQMRQNAPKVIFLEYENPERNLSYLGYLPVLTGEYCTFYYEKYCNGKKDISFTNIKNYFKNGALEGILHILPEIFPNSPNTLLKRKSLGFGGIGMVCIEWN